MLAKDPNADLEELHEFDYFSLDEYEEAKAKKAQAHDLGRVTNESVHVEIAHFDGAGDSAEGKAPLADTENVVSPSDEAVTAESRICTAPSETGT